jgi:hypothetical protein
VILVAPGIRERDRLLSLEDALFRVADHEAPHIANAARHAAAMMRNFDFFGAPLAGIVLHAPGPWPGQCSKRGYVSVRFDAGPDRTGARRARGSRWRVRDVVRTELNIPPELMIIRGLAVAYTDPYFLANKLHFGHDPVAKHVVLLDH